MTRQVQACHVRDRDGSRRVTGKFRCTTEEKSTAAARRSGYTHAVQGVGVENGTPMQQEGLLGVAIEMARRALEGTLSHDIRHVLQEEATRVWTARTRSCHPAMVMGEQMFAHLRPPHARVAHLAREHLLLPPAQPFLPVLPGLRFFLRFLQKQRRRFNRPVVCTGQSHQPVERVRDANGSPLRR